MALAIVQERARELDVLGVVVGDRAQAGRVDVVNRGARIGEHDRGVCPMMSWQLLSTSSFIRTRSASWRAGESAASGSSRM